MAELTLLLNTSRKPIDGWRVDRLTSKGTTMQVHSTHNSNQIQLIIHGEGDINMLAVSGLLFETDLYPEWITLCKKAEDVLWPGLA